MVVKLNPVHFDALNGVDVCHTALGDYSAAITAFRRALEIRLILECTARMS